MMVMFDNIDKIIQADRAEAMKTSSQLTLGEMILKLEAMPDKSLPISFDVKGFYPSGVDSWRGSYAELAICYEKRLVAPFFDTILRQLKLAVGATFIGYKGGEFLMGRATPIWVANYGEAEGFRKGGETAVVDVVEVDGWIVIKTEAMEY